jgi:hypothetical protein
MPDLDALSDERLVVVYEDAYAPAGPWAKG